MPTAEILSQGDEVVTGQVADTNAAWLATRLTDLGFTITRHTSVGDRLPHLVDAFTEVAARCDLVVCTGGLGPTEDDLTATAVAQAFEQPLVFDEVAMEHIEALYARFGRKMPEVNRKQAWLPTGALRLDNDWGTAPGFAVDTGGAWAAFLPGVPREMRKMFEVRVLPELQSRFDLSPGRLVTLRTTGIGESNLQERVELEPGDHVTVSYRTKLPENHVKLRFAANVSELQMRDVVGTVAAQIGSPLFTIEGLPGEPLYGFDCDGGSLPEVVGRALVTRAETLSVAESCTGGRLGAICTAVSGASWWFLEGVITYSNTSKVRLLGIDPDELMRVGAVSETVGRQMATGIRQRAGSTYGLASTGIAGPTGGSADKPVGTVHIALASPNVTLHRELHLAGDRERIQTLAASAALDLLRRQLQNLV